MNKAQLIDAIAKKTGLTKSEAKKALDAFIETTTNALKNGNRVALLGFGSFVVATRSARTGRNPRTGVTINISGKKVVKFNTGAELSNVIDTENNSISVPSFKRKTRDTGPRRK